MWGLAGDWSPLWEERRLLGLGLAGLVGLASPGVELLADLLGVLALGAGARRLVGILRVGLVGQALEPCAHALLVDGLFGPMPLVLDDHEVVTLRHSVAALVLHFLGKDSQFDRRLGWLGSRQDRGDSAGRGLGQYRQRNC